MIGIIDYGMGNIHSVQKAFSSMGAKTVITNKPGQVSSCDKLVLPGVGAFSDALLDLKQQGLIPAVIEHIAAGKIFLGICLGLQLLFESSQESPRAKGLGLLAGEVKKFPSREGLKVPHMGWNQIRLNKPDCPILKNIDSGAYVYFCHSYYPQVQDEKIAAAATDYGVSFASVIWQDNIFALQFHPEKSQKTGLRILEKFVKL